MGNKMYRQAFAVLIIWNVIDGYISYLTGFQINIVSNLCCLWASLYRFIGQEIAALGTLRRFNPRLQFGMHFRR